MACWLLSSLVVARLPASSRQSASTRANAGAVGVSFGMRVRAAFRLGVLRSLAADHWRRKLPGDLLGSATVNSVELGGSLSAASARVARATGMVRWRGLLPAIAIAVPELLFVVAGTCSVHDLILTSSKTRVLSLTSNPLHNGAARPRSFRAMHQHACRICRGARRSHEPARTNAPG